MSVDVEKALQAFWLEIQRKSQAQGLGFPKHNITQAHYNASTLCCAFLLFCMFAGVFPV